MKNTPEQRAELQKVRIDDIARIRVWDQDTAMRAVEDLFIYIDTLITERDKWHQAAEEAVRSQLATLRSIDSLVADRDTLRRALQDIVKMYVDVPGGVAEFADKALAIVGESALAAGPDDKARIEKP